MSKITLDRLRQIQDAVAAGHPWKALQMLEKHGVRNKKIRRTAKDCNRLLRYISSTHSQWPVASFRQYDSDLQTITRYILTTATQLTK